MKLSGPIGIAVVALFWAGLITWFVRSQGQSQTPLTANSIAPDFTVHDAAGNPVHLSDYRGHTVVLIFWASWCAPAQQALPQVNAAVQPFKKDGVSVLVVNVWDKEDTFDGWSKKFETLKNLKFTIDPTPQGNDVATSKYNVNELPTEYVIDKNGKIVKGSFNPTQTELAQEIHTAVSSG